MVVFGRILMLFAGILMFIALWYVGAARLADFLAPTTEDDELIQVLLLFVFIPAGALAGCWAGFWLIRDEMPQGPRGFDVEQVKGEKPRNIMRFDMRNRRTHG